MRASELPDARMGSGDSISQERLDEEGGQLTTRSTERHIRRKTQGLLPLLSFGTTSTCYG